MTKSERSRGAPAPPAETWPTISTATLSDRVYNAIRDRILRGDMTPGGFIRELDVSASLGVSRTPVREALARLAREGFLERLARRGFRIPIGSIDRLLELYPVVAALEVLAGELAFPRIDAATLARLRDLNRGGLEAWRQGRSKETIEQNYLFHQVLSERCGNQRLCDLLNELRAQVVRLEQWSTDQREHVPEAFQQHDEIIQAIERGDYPTALTLLKVNRLQTYTAFYDTMSHGGLRPKQNRKGAKGPAA